MVDTSGHRMPPDDEVPDRFYELCIDWAERLRDEKLPFTRLALICKEICNTVGRKAAAARYGAIDLADVQPSPPATLDPAALDTFAPELPPMVVARRLLAHLLDGRKTHSQRKIVAKSYYNVWCQNLLDGAPLYTMWGVHDLADPDDNSVALYGMLHSRFLTPLQTVPGLAGMVAERNLTLFLSPAAGYTRWFNTASENVLAIARHVGPPGLYGHERPERLWHVALTNLESPYHGAREYMLALLKLLVRDETFAHRTVRPEWARWSWLDRNKFHLLALLLERYRWEKLRDALPLTEQQLGDGLRLSLRYKHLYAGGQTLVRLLYTNQHMADTVYGLVARVILAEPAAIVQTMVKYWFSFFTPKSYRTVYERLALDAILITFAQRPGPTDGDTLPPYLSTNRYEKLFLLVYLFRQQVQSSGVLQPLLVQLCALAETLQPLAPATLDMLICSLGHYLVACGATGRIDTLQHMVALTRHVQCAMEAPGQMATCRTCVTVCQRLLTHIATTQQEQHRTFPLDAQAHLAKFMSYDMYDRYLLPAGSTPLDYQPTVTALRLFAAFVEQCFEFPATSPYVLQIRADGAVCWIGPLLPATLPLPELGASFRSMVYGLQHLLRSDFDDIRAITLTMLYNRAGAFCYDPRLQSQLATVHSAAAATPDAPDQVRTTVRLLLNVTLARLAAALDDHERDFYASVLAAEEDNPSGQLHRLIERCTEVCFGFAGPAGGSSVLSGDDLLDAHCCLDTVCAFMLRSLGPTPPADQCIVQTNFRQLDRCLERLLNQSDVWRRTRTVADDAEEAGSSDCLQVSLAKRKIQVALWKTLRALAIFFEQHAIRIMDRQVRSAGEQLDVFRQELESLVAIMVSCCHRGAIEATGLSLSRVVRHAVQLKEQDPTLHRTVKQVYCRWRDYAPASPDDFRENRGLIWMRHCFLRHDTTDLREGSLLRDLLHHKLKLGECALYHERGGQRVTVEVLWLHQLNLIARETALNESILPHLDELLIVALSHIRVPRWCVRNAALQLYASCAQKLTGQGQQQCDPGADWPPAYTAFEEVACKATRTIRYMIRQLDGMLPAPTNGYRRSKRRTQPDHCPTIPFQLLVLQFLSKLEYRGYGQHHHPEPVAPSSATPCPPHLEMVGKLRAILWQLLGHEHDLVRKLAARCFAQLHDYATELPALLDPLVHELFSTRGSVNFRHGLCRTVLACVQRYVTLCRHVQRDETARASQRTATLQRVREMVSRHWHHETSGTAPFRYRSELLGLLHYLGFARDSPVLEALVLNRTAPNAFGQAVLVMQLNQLYGGAACTVSPAGVVSIDPALIDTGEPCAQSTALPYEVSLEWDRELDALEAVEDD
ncbi:uncharacterized protein LOC1272438 [Anopheles gambiae]|uniref:uncharacterized protein LOC1272438 n=1 Tax=Anopheles gambiae TaxID=7165 RepID=UPI002AC91D0C|nr:uncharacterized protein LOC1272438 [Anopheles gambiae]